jgi:phage-related holin
MEAPATATALSVASVLKNSAYGVAFIIGSEYLGFKAEAGAVLITLMIIDTCAGIARSAAVNGLPSITSSIGTRGLLAKILTLVGILSLAIAFKGIGYDAQNAVQGIVAVFILAETYSIVGNIHSILTGKQKAEYDAMAFLVGIVKNALQKTAGK